MKRVLPAALLAALIAAVVFGLVQHQQLQRLRTDLTQARTLVRVLDGDTVELDGGERVRIIGINAPETWERKGKQWRRIENADPKGVAAWEWLSSHEGRSVRVTLGQERRDRYGRTLAHLYLLPDGPDVACELIRRGLVEVQAWPPNTTRYGQHKALAKAAEK